MRDTHCFKMEASESYFKLRQKLMTKLRNTATSHLLKNQLNGQTSRTNYWPATISQTKKLSRTTSRGSMRRKISCLGSAERLGIRGFSAQSTQWSWLLKYSAHSLTRSLRKFDTCRSPRKSTRSSRPGRGSEKQNYARRSRRKKRGGQTQPGSLSA